MNTHDIMGQQYVPTERPLGEGDIVINKKSGNWCVVVSLEEGNRVKVKRNDQTFILPLAQVFHVERVEEDEVEDDMIPDDADEDEDLVDDEEEEDDDDDNDVRWQDDDDDDNDVRWQDDDDDDNDVRWQDDDDDDNDVENDPQYNPAHRYDPRDEVDYKYS